MPPLQELPSLVRKYARSGPRYTSYPPANHFVPIEDLTPYLEANRTAQGPLSLYIHLPFCRSQCWYCGCHSLITRDPRRADTYLDLLEREALLLTAQLQPKRPVQQVHLGGGTPNFLSPAQIERLDTILRTHFSIAGSAECSVELDPRYLDETQVVAFAQAGFNRASFGIQDCDPEVQAAIHRKQTDEHNRNAMHWLRAAGINSVNVDLIYGLPQQTLESFRTTVDTVLALQPDRFTLFSYAHVPWMKPHQRRFTEDILPDVELKLALFLQAMTQLREAGFEYIGLDHFARPDDELFAARRNGTLQRNFQGYSTQAGLSLIGLGISSISQTPDTYYQNAKALDTYARAIHTNRLPLERGYRLSAEDRHRRTLIMTLMCNLALPFGTLSETLGLDVRTHYAAEIASLRSFEADGLLHLDHQCIEITDTGRFFLRNIAMVFDAFFEDSRQQHSKTI